MNVVPLHREVDAFDLAKALRNIADEIEKGEYQPAPTMAVVVLAHDSQRREASGDVIDSFGWQTHGLGKGCSVFTAKGILAAAMGAFDG